MKLNSHRRTILFLSIALSALGAMSFNVMPRQEDPRIRERNAVATVIYPGAKPEKIERLIARPIEDALASVAELKNVRTEIRFEVVNFVLQLRDDINTLSDAWRRVERAIEGVHLPDGVTLPSLDFTVLDVESVVLAVTGSDDPMTLRDAALELKDQLLQVEGTSRVRLFGDPGAEIAVEVDTQRLRRLGLTLSDIARNIQGNNAGSPGGSLIRGGRTLVVEQRNDARSVEDLGKIELETARLETVSLASVATLSRRAPEPPAAVFRWNGKSALGIGIVAKEGVNVVRYGKAVMEKVTALRTNLAPLQLEVVAYQPQRTEDRIHELMTSLVIGVVLIVVFLVLTYGSRMAILVGATVPAISLISLFAFFLLGGEIQQISIAAFVISIGQFIDNIIVMVDTMDQKQDQGTPLADAAQESFRELRRPMLFATLTGMCAFLPMLSATGGTADFVFSFPQVAMITLGVSYFFAIYTTPLLASLWSQKSKPLLPLPIQSGARAFGALAAGPLWRVFAITFVLLLSSLAALYFVPKEFFPESDRKEFLLTLELPPSTAISRTDSALREAERYLRTLPEVQSSAAFAGGGIPRFYYNLPNPRRAPQVGQLLVTVKELSDVRSVGLKLERHLRGQLPDADVVAQFLQQGPPIEAKIEVRAYAPQFERQDALMRAAEQVLRSLQATRGVRSDLEDVIEVRTLRPQTRALGQIGWTQSELNLAVGAESTGVVVSLFREGRESIPIRLMSTTHVHSTDQQFNGAVAYLGRERDFKLGELTQSSDRFERAVIRRKDSQRYGRVLSELAPEATFDQVMGPLQKASEQWGLKPGERIEFGGDAEGAGEANASIFKVVPIAMLMLLIFLLIQFQSFGKLAVAFLALPVTVLGAFPGLLIGGAPFGFMSLLGILALVGIAINNIILLLEAMDETSDLRSAIERRFRPIFLSTSLTFLGLFPLALEGGTLWPPLAWTLISGLVTGTFATLVLVPGLIRVLQRLKFRASGSATLALLMVGVSSSWAQPSISLEQIMDLSDQTAEAQASKALLLSAQEELSRANRAAFFPSLTLGGETWMRDQTLTSSTPFGNLLQEKKQRSDFKLELRQPLLNLAQMVYARAAERLALDSAQLRHAHTVGALRFSVGAHALETLILGHQIRFAQESVRLLDLQTQDLERLLDRGRVRSTELIRLRHESQKARQSLQDLQSKQLQSRVHLERRLGIGLTLPISAPFEASPAPLVGPERPEPLDVRAQQTTAESTLARSALARAAYVPEVDLFVRGVSSQGTTLAETRWGEAGVTLRWELWGQGVRSSQARSALLQAEAQSQSARAFADQRQREIAESRETWARKLTFLKEVTKLLRMAQEQSTKDEQKHREGRMGASDYVKSQLLVRELERDEQVTRLEILLECMRIQSLQSLRVEAQCVRSQ